MSVNYNLTAINDRLQGVATAIDAGGAHGNFRLLSAGNIVSTIPLARPCGTVSNGVLTFSGTLQDTSAAGTGIVDGARIEDSLGNTIVFGLTTGSTSTTGIDIQLSNGLGTTLVSSGQMVVFRLMQIGISFVPSTYVPTYYILGF